MLREARGLNEIFHNDGAAKRTGAKKRGYAPMEMEHKRTNSEHEESGSTTFYETRGVRDTSNVFLFGDFAETLALGNYSGEVDKGTFESLFEAANYWLREVGEPDFRSITNQAEKARETVRTNKQKNRIDRATFQQWWFEIGMKHGFLSPAAIAANFLTASDFVHRLANGNKQLEFAIYQFADAWHWMHFEGKGEHELAAIGWKSAQGRAQGPAVKQRRAEMKKQIVKAAYEAFAADEKNGPARKSAKGAAGALLKELSQKLSALGLGRIAEKSLTDELRPLIKERFPKPTKRKAS